MRAANSSTVSVGCELRSSVLSRVSEFKAEGLIEHVQVTIPTGVSLSVALEMAVEFPTVAHCNLLNAFGSNKWIELAPIASRIRQLKPVHVIEHFTALRADDGTKNGVWFDAALFSEQERLRVLDQVKRWQDILGVPLCLENVPVSADVERYFDLLLEIRDKSGCGIVCDFPHLLISAISAGIKDKTLESLCADLAPTQVHIAGVSTANGVLRDNHRAAPLWVARMAQRYFPQTRYLTFEQDGSLPADHLKEVLIRLRSEDHQQVPQALYESKGITHEEANEGLAADAARDGRFPACVRRVIPSDEGVLDSRTAHTKHLPFPMYLYGRYLPFVYPIESIEQGFEDMNPQEAVQVVALLCRSSLECARWWHGDDTPFMTLTYGDVQGAKFEKNIALSVQSEESQVEKKFDRSQFDVFRFTSSKGFWVEVAAPRLVSRQAATDMEVI